MTNFKKVTKLEQCNVYTSGNTMDVSAEHLTALCDQIDNGFLESFMGVKLVVDENLTGNNWHVSVSKELYDRLGKSY